jgi:LmbE family N-acetylglucosaminyl deacetylase
VFQLGFQVGAEATVLCIGAHCDDVEIGCGATLVRLAREYPRLRFEWAVFSGDESRQAETRAAARALLGDERCSVRFMGFRESYFPARFSDVKDACESLKPVAPALVFTHRLEDRHQDHALLANLTWNTFRGPTVLEYEIPKFEGDLGQPNLYFPVTAADLDRKVGTLLDCFPTQRARSWFTADTFRGLARLRGIECVAPDGWAEAFHARKLRV